MTISEIVKNLHEMLEEIQKGNEPIGGDMEKHRRYLVTVREVIAIFGEGDL